MKLIVSYKNKKIDFTDIENIIEMIDQGYLTTMFVRRAIRNETIKNKGKKNRRYSVLLNKYVQFEKEVNNRINEQKW